MFKTRVLAQRIFLCNILVINVENHGKIAFMKIKKKCRAGAKCCARWDQNHLIFLPALIFEGVISEGAYVYLKGLIFRILQYVNM